MLLTGGADPNIRTTTPGCNEPVIHWNIHHGSLEVTKLLLRFGVELYGYESDGIDALPRHALHQCARFGHTDHAEVLLAAGADPNIRDWTGDPPLFTALRKGSIGIVKLLIKPDDLSKKIENGEGVIDALFDYRTFEGHDTRAAECLSLLLEEGLDIETLCVRGKTVIAAAAYARAYESVEVCIKAGSKLDVYTFSNETILTSLLRDCNSKVKKSPIQKKLIYLIEMMIKAGADVNFQSSETPHEVTICRGTVAGACPETPLQVAISRGTVAGAWLLLQANCSEKITRRDRGARKFMEQAIREEAHYCAVFMFGDFCQTTEDQQVFFDLSQKKKAMVNAKLVGLIQPPLSLARLCRLAVRATLPSGAAFSPAVDKLPLPTNVKDYVALRYKVNAPVEIP